MKKRFRFISALCVLASVLALAACGGLRTAVDEQPEASVGGESKTLVAYFSWSGNDRQMARWIADETGADLFRIVPKESYGTDYNAVADRAKAEKESGTRPELSTHIDEETMKNYDVIYLGFPIWWYDLPTPVWSFLEEYDLSGKTIIPFFSHAGSSDGANSLTRISELAKGAEVHSDKALSIRGSSVASSEEKVREWAKENGR